MKPGSKEFWAGVDALVASLGSKNYYEVLGVAVDASPADIDDAHRSALRSFHPDRYAMEPDPRRRMALTRLCARINEAKRVLGVPAKRVAYNQTLDTGGRRMLGEQVGRRRYSETRDPMTAQGRSFYEKGCSFLDDGELTKAKAQLSLAMNYEPASPAIRAAMDKLQALESAPAKAPAPKEEAKGESTERSKRLAEELFGSD